MIDQQVLQPRRRRLLLVAAIGICALAAGCERREPLSLIDGCLNANLADKVIPISTKVTCEVDTPIELLLVPRTAVTAAELRAVDFPTDAVEFLAESAHETSELCLMLSAGPPVHPDPQHPYVVRDLRGTCVESRFEISHPLVVRGRRFTFLLGRSHDRYLLVGVGLDLTNASEEK